jgi:hypothetical protein
MRGLLIYLLLVGAPLIGVLTVLHVGRDIRPVTSVAGAWVIESDFAPLTNTPCAKLVTTIKQPALNITQSGRQLVLRLNTEEKTTFDGEVKGTTLEGGRSPSGASAEGGLCGGEGGVYLKAEVKKEGMEALRLSGQLIIAGCKGCSPLVFNAVRQRPMKADSASN